MRVECEPGFWYGTAAVLALTTLVDLSLLEPGLKASIKLSLQVLLEGSATIYFISHGSLQ